MPIVNKRKNRLNPLRSVLKKIKHNIIKVYFDKGLIG